MVTYEVNRQRGRPHSVGWRGLPQGSPLSPVLSVMVAHWLCRVKVESGHVLTYLDDHVLIAEGHTLEIANQRLAQAYQRFEEVMNTIRLSVEQNKCAYMVFKCNSNGLSFRFPNGEEIPAI